MNKKDIPFRQIHLDFHTSKWIEDVAVDFDKEEFAKTLDEANVNSVTCFARCHHGYLYYPSKKHPEFIHPHLKNKNLLLEQIEACHARGIKVPIYTTVQWDQLVMENKKECLCLDLDGKYIDTQGVAKPHFYHSICLNSGYRKFLKEHIEDIVDVVGSKNVDGFFLDILFPVPCACENCKEDMQKRGMDYKDDSVRKEYSIIMLREFKKEFYDLMKSLVPDATVFFNSSHIGPAFKEDYNYYSHLEMESLPSGGWGYDHFPITSKYAINLDKDLVGMTGKFHTYWGDFHSLKNKAALEFECFQMIASGTKCSIGDQLHPRGKLSRAAYSLIGDVYSKINYREQYLINQSSVAKIGVLTPEESDKTYGISESITGVMRLFRELSYQFDIIDSEMDFSKYKLIVLPDYIPFSLKLEDKLLDFKKNGGVVLASYKSLEKEGYEQVLGIKIIEESPYYREFILGGGEKVGKNLFNEEYVMYGPSVNIETEGEVLLDKIRPYYNREGDKFCSHQHFPSSGEKYYPDLVKTQGAFYFAHPIFELYRKNGANWIKQIFKDTLKMIDGINQVEHNGPSTLATFLMEQKTEKRYVLHLINYIVEKRYKDIYTIEDVISLNDLELSLNLGRKIKRIREIGLEKVDSNNKFYQNVNYERDLEFYEVGGEVFAKIKKMCGYHMLILDYED